MITTRLYLDSRRSANQDTPAPLKLSIYWNKAESYLFTGIKLAPSQWDKNRRLAKDKAVQVSISRFKVKVDTLLDDWQEAGKLDGLNALEIRRRVEMDLSPDKVRKQRFLAWLQKFGQTRRKPRTREIYQATVARIKAFAPDAEFLTFEDITFAWLDRFDTFLSQTAPKKNSRNIHFRNIKAAFRNAMKNGVTTWYPFFQFEIHPEETAKRNLTVDQIRKLFNAEVEPWQQKYIDFFKISFMLIAINTEDLLHATEINDGRLEYIRAKTGKPYSIKVEPECMNLIEKYRGEKYLLNILDTYANTHNWTSKVDNVLHEICDNLGLPKNTTMYWARHSWNTIAQNELDISQDIASRALGHGKKTVNDIYLNFDITKIDRANRQVLDYILYNKKTENVFDLIKQLNEKVDDIVKKADKSA